MSTKTVIFKNVSDKGKYFAIENQKYTIFLKFANKKKPSNRWAENAILHCPTLLWSGHFYEP